MAAHQIFTHCDTTLVLSIKGKKVHIFAHPFFVLLNLKHFHSNRITIQASFHFFYCFVIPSILLSQACEASHTAKLTFFKSNLLPTAIPLLRIQADNHKTFFFHFHNFSSLYQSDLQSFHQASIPCLTEQYFAMILWSWKLIDNALRQLFFAYRSKLSC